MKHYKIELLDGDKNGAIRYYETLGVATREAKRYIKRVIKNYPSDNPCVYIYFLDDNFKSQEIAILDESNI
jgi:hypothetical protein